MKLKDALFLGFCAVFIVSAKAVLRLHLKIPGHSMFFTIFFLFIARGCVNQRLASSFAGLLAGIMTMILGMGKGGPLLLIKFALPGLVIDLMAVLLPALFQSLILCLLTAVLAAFTHFLTTFMVDYLVGMDPEIMLQHALIKSVGNILFAMGGGALVPTVMGKLKAHGLVNNKQGSNKPERRIEN